MIFEQAFYNLPEILVGTRYLEQEYETGITGAVAMAVLQELNGRNINNPIAHIHLEHGYQVPPGTQRRPIRADMFLRTQAIRVANKALDAYGWRFQNHLEAKFIKNSSNQTNVRAELAVDLVRLACLARAKPSQQEAIGRYLLHVYKGAPEELVGGKLTAAGHKRKNYQVWLEQIRLPGVNDTVVLDVAADKAAGVTSRFPAPLDRLKLTLRVRNLEIAPLWTIQGSQYWCYLTKLEAMRVERSANDWSSIALDRSISESAPGMHDFIWQDVYRNIDP